MWKVHCTGLCEIIDRKALSTSRQWLFIWNRKGNRKCIYSAIWSQSIPFALCSFIRLLSGLYIWTSIRTSHPVGSWFNPTVSNRTLGGLKFKSNLKGSSLQVRAVCRKGFLVLASNETLKRDSHLNYLSIRKCLQCCKRAVKASIFLFSILLVFRSPPEIFWGLKFRKFRASWLLWSWWI